MILSIWRPLRIDENDAKRWEKLVLEEFSSTVKRTLRFIYPSLNPPKNYSNHTKTNLLRGPGVGGGVHVFYIGLGKQKKSSETTRPRALIFYM